MAVFAGPACELAAATGKVSGRGHAPFAIHPRISAILLVAVRSALHHVRSGHPGPFTRRRIVLPEFVQVPGIALGIESAASEYPQVSVIGGPRRAQPTASRYVIRG